MLVHLPSGLVPLLNALHWSLPEYSAELELFSTSWSEFEGAVDFQSSYYLSEDEKDDIENLKILWASVDRSLDDELDFNKLASETLEAVGLWEKLSKARERAIYSPIPAVNELLLAGGAFCSEQGEIRAIRDRIMFVEQTAISLLNRFDQRRPELEDEVADALQQGFELIGLGLSRLNQGVESTDLIQQSLAEIKDGASLVEILLEWERKDDELIRSEYKRFNIPLVGSELELSLETLSVMDRSEWSIEIQVLKEDLFPRLAMFWYRASPALILPAEERPGIMQDADEALAAVAEAVVSLADPEIDKEQALELMIEALEWASDAFTAVDQEAVRSDMVPAGAKSDCFEAIQGILGGTVPDAALSDLLERNPLKSELQNILLSYLNGDAGTEVLFEAGCALVPRQYEIIED